MAFIRDRYHQFPVSVRHGHVVTCPTGNITRNSIHVPCLYHPFTSLFWLPKPPCKLQILDHSFFQFIDTIYHQITGTSMGTGMAPPYANLFMGRVEHKILQFFHTFITIWKRFIDDIFFIFTGTLEQLTHLINYMNALHPPP